MQKLLESINESFTSIDITIFLFRLIFSTICSLLIAFHPSEIKDIANSKKTLKMAKAKILLCLAGTIMINVIGDSLSRAFGLFGLGSFIKFRTSIEDVNDTAVMFMLIAMGMTIGTGLYIHAFIVLIFIYLFLLFFKTSKKEKVKEKKLKLEKVKNEKVEFKELTGEVYE